MNQLTISEDAIRRNYRTLSEKLRMPLMPMVKAGGYGTSAPLLAKLYEELAPPLLGVAYTQEALHLREAGIKAPLFILHPFPEEAPLIREEKFDVAISSVEEVDLYRGAPLHLHLNTGMNRLGCRPQEALQIGKKAKNLAGMMTHFAAAGDEKEDPFTLKQASEFIEVVQRIERQGIPIRYKHGSNSPAALRFDLPMFNLARIGIALLQDALTLTSRLVAIHPCKKGDTVSYGRTYRTSEKERIGVVPLGYHDGIPRAMQGAGIKVQNKTVPIVGTVCMDFLMVSLKNVPEATVGDPVTLFSTSGEIEILSQHCQTISYELIARLGPRIKRVMQPLLSAERPLELECGLLL